ncbi:MAG: glycosyltransferase family 4 protein [bacterium]
MRILHVTDSFAPKVGGIEHQVESLARHQLAGGHEVGVVTAVPGDDVAELAVLRPPGSRVRTSGSPRQLRLLSRAALGVGGFDVVHAHLSLASPLAVHTARYASRHHVPLAVTVHSVWPPRAVLRVANLPYWFGPIRGAWSAVSAAAADSVRPSLGPDVRVDVVPNIVDTTWWHPQDRWPAADRTPGAGRRPVHVVTVGRLARRKRVQPFLRVLREVRHRTPAEIGIRVTVIGDGPQRIQLAAMLRETGMDAWVELAGQLDPLDIRAVLHEADLFVAPARRESFGIAALEARAAGLPVLGLRGNGLSDFIAEGKEGLLADDDAGLADALVELLTEPELRAELRAFTLSHPPRLSAGDAVLAADELYERALGSAARGDALAVASPVSSSVP